MQRFLPYRSSPTRRSHPQSTREYSASAQRCLRSAKSSPWARRSWRCYSLSMSDLNEEWLDLAWWNLHCGDRLAGKRVAEVKADLTKAIRQINSSVVPFSIRLTEGEAEVGWERVVLKHVLLASEGLASPTANGTSAKQSSSSNRAKSYSVEAAFYRDFAERIKQVGAVVPSALCCECNEREQLLVLEDLSHEGALWHEVTGRSQEQLLTLNETQTKLALDWVARLHAHFWGRSSPHCSEGLWPIGSYWSLEKRLSELAGMEEEWKKTVSNFQGDFPDVFGRISVQQLATRLKLAATALANSLDVSGAWVQSQWCTVIHGDYKTANMFFSHVHDAAGEQKLSVCDFQWTGRGLGVLDVLYVLNTSSDPALVAKEEDTLLEYYFTRLHCHLDREVAAGNVSPSAVASYTRKIFLQHYQVAYLDYVRFLMGRMWGAVTPQSCQNLAMALNHGTHKRFASHLVHMTCRADAAMAELEARGWPHTADMQLPMVKAPLMLRILNVAAELACAAGVVIRQMLDDAGGTMGASADKGDFGFGEADPQTLADLAAEKCIINGLARAFPGLTVVGEEGLATSDSGADEALDATGSGPVTLKFIPVLFEDGLDETDLFDPTIELDDVCVWVDPLDGTQEFVDGNLERVTVLIGITVRGKPVAGAILQPFVNSGSAAGGKGRLLWGGIGLGVWDGGADGIAGATRVRSGPCDGKPVVATSRSHPSPAVAEAAAALEPREVLQLGGAGSKVVMIIEGRLSHWVYPRKGTKRWDTAAPEALLRAVGGFCVDSNGRPYDYSADCQPRNDEGVIAGSGRLAWEQCVTAFGWQPSSPS